MRDVVKYTLCKGTYEMLYERSPINVLCDEYRSPDLLIKLVTQDPRDTESSLSLKPHEHKKSSKKDE